ncbi:hypothetical protein [Shewanella glacialipiscicola]|uniref:hypothetical protein n=1 Tax=Shewanella glacialipiscicola TaxID=614069 RepID=UPI003D7BC5B8
MLLNLRVKAIKSAAKASKATIERIERQVMIFMSLIEYHRSKSEALTELGSAMEIAEERIRTAKHSHNELVKSVNEKEVKLNGVK